ncbi:LytR/AlgR family response regulator transcription factor [Pseudotenacibaculum haliotis]|uniref:LytR/AlgR family response regulator transcription factor n=1 Tax=Pseudotenacibaculum haliotis TaxID=1862138 RepID=A0ABW5LT22_9FLAO
MKINCLIIDDEPTSQLVLKNFLSKLDFLHLSGVCNNAIEAMSVLSQQPVDLIFLDINMPQISGLSFYKSLSNPPAVIFSTAYSEHAVEAFDVSAVDYLLKPFSFERFLVAVNKAVQQIQSKDVGKQASESILIKADKKLHKIETDNIYYIEAFGDYVKIHLENEFIMTNNTFKKILAMLPTNFVRIHKSYAINLKEASTVEGNLVVLNDNKLPIGVKFRPDFLDRFKNE